MSATPSSWPSRLSRAMFALLPTLPYAPSEKAGCGGIAIRATNLTARARADGPVAFQDASFEIPCGCRAALIGPNGSGKSTLLRVLAGLTRAESGTVFIGDATPRTGRRRIAYLSQRPHLTAYFPLRLRRLVQMGTYAHHGWLEECFHGDQAVDLALERMGLTELSDRPVHTLSGGQLQRGLIARAIVQGAEILLLDEPYAALDQSSREIIDRFLFSQGQHFTVLMATHDPADLARFDRILELRDHAVTTRRACDGHGHHHA